MTFLKRIFRTVEFMLILSIFAFTYINFKANIPLVIILFSLCLFLTVNEFIRLTKLGYKSNYAKASLLTSIILVNILHYTAGHVHTIILMYLFLYDIFKLEKNVIKRFAIFHSILYFPTLIISSIHVPLGITLVILTINILAYSGICGMLYNLKNLKLEKEEIAKSSITDLRKTVSLLSSDLEIKCFDKSIEKLIDNFNLFNDIKFTYEENQSIEDLSPNIKTALYKTIQEAITNSLKHGNASEISIKLERSNSNLKLIIRNNGLKCINIVNSNGLNGIESRIQSLNGSVQYINKGDLGFGIKISIPV